MGIPDHLTCLLRNLYAGQEAAVRTGHGTTDWFQIGKGVRKGCIVSPCLLNFYVMTNLGSIFKSRDITLPTKVHLVKAMTIHDYWKNHINFLPRGNRLLISWLQSPSAVILEPPKIKSDTVSPSISHEVMVPDAMIFVFRMLSCKSTFSVSSITLVFTGRPDAKAETPVNTLATSCEELTHWKRP